MRPFNKLSLFIVALSLGASTGQATPKYGPEKNPIAHSLATDHSYFSASKAANAPFWNLIGYYIPQQTGASCSVASVTMVINAARAQAPRSSDLKVVSQSELVSKVKAHDWGKRTGLETGLKPTGVTLDMLRDLVEEAFKAYEIPTQRIGLYRANTRREFKAELTKVLTELALSKKLYIIANFDQKSFTDDTNAGHIAPIAAYDAAKKRVLILDPDREYYEPYWVSLDALISGMNTEDSSTKSMRGYIVVETRS